MNHRSVGRHVFPRAVGAGRVRSQAPMRAAVFVFALAAIAGCASREVTEIEIGDHGLEYGFFVLRGEEGRPTRVSRVFHVDGDRFSFGDEGGVELEDGEETVLLAGFTRADLQSISPLFAVDRAAELAVLLVAAAGDDRRQRRNRRSARDRNADPATLAVLHRGHAGRSRRARRGRRGDAGDRRASDVVDPDRLERVPHAR
jgi:hypothetical protein